MFKTSAFSELLSQRYFTRKKIIRYFPVQTAEMMPSVKTFHAIDKYSAMI
ncbi:hypothetical protein BSM4216_1849 [Bacillus smithii]|nr:hypothetical protein BSM4216_1849 [Bacillus smithii]